MRFVALMVCTTYIGSPARAFWSAAALEPRKGEGTVGATAVQEPILHLCSRTGKARQQQTGGDTVVTIEVTRCAQQIKERAELRGDRKRVQHHDVVGLKLKLLQRVLRR